MNIEDFLELLTPEQLEQLANLKRKEQSGEIESVENLPKKQIGKRKQQRKKKPSPGQSKTGTLENIIGKKGAPARRDGGLQLGPRPNKFITSSDFKADLDIIEQDKQLWKGRTPSPRNRTQIAMDATCTRCNTEYEDIPESLCYKDGNKYIFTCDNCTKSSGRSD